MVLVYVLTAEILICFRSPPIVDSVPLFHQSLETSPLAEVALMLIERLAGKSGLHIIGYYCAAEHFYDNSIDKAPGMRIAEKISENCKNAYVVVLDNRGLTMNMKHPTVKVWQWLENKWTKGKYNIHDQSQTIEAVNLMLQKGVMKQLLDFDNHLDHPEQPWPNDELDTALESILAMDAGEDEEEVEESVE